MSPTQFANIGSDIITEWAQVTDRLISYAAIFEARGGLDQFNNAKHQGEELTPQQEADNAELDRLGALALDVVTHHNELVQWYDAGRRVRVAQRRNDY